MRLLPMLLTVALCAASARAQAPVTVDTVNLLHEQIANTRPNPDGPATTVIIGLYIADIVKLDDVHQSFTADIALRVAWHDPRLADPEAPLIRHLRPNEIWTPHMTFLNKRRVWTSWDDYVVVDRQGNVLYRQRYFGDFTARLNLRDFPFDRNNLSIQIVAPDYPPDELTFVVDPKATGRSPQFSLVDAAISEGAYSNEPFFFAPGDLTMSSLVYEFEIERYHAYYLWKVILPLAVIVMMSWLVFWVDPTQLGPQLGLSATAVLTLIAYRFLLGNLVPKVSYLTRLDVFIVGATIVVFLGLVETALVADLSLLGKEERARRIDRGCRAIFPIVFVALVVVAFII